ncbi:MAG: hypothetical protein ABWY82_06995, partial [Tardiphaga sp.]
GSFGMDGTTKRWRPRDANRDLRKHSDGGDKFIRRNLTPEAPLAAFCLLPYPKIGVLAENHGAFVKLAEGSLKGALSIY